MAQNYRTDLNNLNKLYRINRNFNSPKIIRNISTNENKNPKNIVLERYSPYEYFPTYVKLLKKNNLFSPVPVESMNTIYNPRFNRSVGDFYSHRKKFSPIMPRIHNNSTDFATRPHIRQNKRYLKNINKLKYSQGTPEPGNSKLTNSKIINISPSYQEKIEYKTFYGSLGDNYILKKNNPRILNNSTNNLKIQNYNNPILINENYNSDFNDYRNRIMNNSISYMTDVNQNRKRRFYKAFPNNSPFREIKNSTTKDNIFINNNIFFSDTRIKLDDLIYLEGKFSDILIALDDISDYLHINSINECVEFFIFYFNSTLKNKFVYFFSEQNHIIIHTAFNLILYMIIITYHLSLNPNMIIKCILILKKIFDLLKINLYLFIKKIELYFGDNFCSKNEIYFNKFNSFLVRNGIYDLCENEIIDIISRNSVNIVNNAHNILNFYKCINSSFYCVFNNIYLSLSKMSEDDLNDFFLNNILNSFEENLNNINYYYYNIDEDNNYENNFYNSNYDNYNNNFILENNEEDDESEEYLDNIILYYKKNKASPPFLKFKNQKKYTLVLDLGGTLINVKIDNNGRAVCYMRPGIISFLSGIKPYYEIIAYSKLSKEYSNLIIRQIERNRNLFDYNLYREHCVLIGNKFVKDISIIGRDMKKIIMVDDVPENLERHIDNGILILPYDGSEESEDDRILFELKKLLILFCKLGYQDLRNAIKCYRKEIFSKITMGNFE